MTTTSNTEIHIGDRFLVKDCSDAGMIVQITNISLIETYGKIVKLPTNNSHGRALGTIHAWSLPHYINEIWFKLGDDEYKENKRNIYDELEELLIHE